MLDPAGDEQPVTPGFIWKTYKIPILLGSVSLFFIALSITILIKAYQSSAPIQFSSDTPEASTATAQTGQITVDVEGAVVRPGLYKLSGGARVEEAIAAAGGLSSDADTDRINQTINRASKLVDGGKLFFPQVGQGAVSGISQVGGPASVAINSASQLELEALPGIGPVTAKKIITNRPYQTLEELVTKKAMGQSLFDKLKDQLTL